MERSAADIPRLPWMRGVLWYWPALALLKGGWLKWLVLGWLYIALNNFPRWLAALIVPPTDNVLGDWLYLVVELAASAIFFPFAVTTVTVLIWAQARPEKSYKHWFTSIAQRHGRTLLTIGGVYGLTQLILSSGWNTLSTFVLSEAVLWWGYYGWLIVDTANKLFFVLATMAALYRPLALLPGLRHVWRGFWRNGLPLAVAAMLLLMTAVAYAWLMGFEQKEGVVRLDSFWAFVELGASLLGNVVWPLLFSLGILLVFVAYRDIFHSQEKRSLEVAKSA